MNNIKYKKITIYLLFILIFIVIGCGDDNNIVNSSSNKKTAYLDYVVNNLDLSTGIIDTMEWFDPRGPAYDVYAVKSEDAEIWHTIGVNLGRLVASIDSVKFSDVTITDAIFASFNTSLSYDAFDSNSVVLVKTNDGQLYKIGNPVKTTIGMTFDYELMLEIPEIP